jgi:adenylylsulfate reductase subunit A
MRIQELDTDILIIGAGAAGCYAALCAARASGARILLVEKAHIERSGCLAAGINAINAYIGEGRSPEDYVRYAVDDAEGIARPDLLLSIAGLFNGTVAALEGMGLVIQKDARGRFAERGWRNVKINGENIKPLLASAVCSEPGVSVLNKVNVTSYLVENNTILGALGFSVEERVRYIFRAPAVICASGGAAGLYLPNSQGMAKHTLWYPPFNTGAGYAMGILAGAEMTSLEMRFVALRCKGTGAPTGTLAQGAGARQLNSLGEQYDKQYGLSTSRRAYGTLAENLAGRGPCRLVAANMTRAGIEDIYKAYLNMAPAQTLKWLEESRNASAPESSSLSAEIEGTEPYLVGGHAACGYWVDTRRRTTINGLFAAGDVAGGCPQKYVSGAMAEGSIAAGSALDYLKRAAATRNKCAGLAALNRVALARLEKEAKFLNAGSSPLFTADQLELSMQTTMDAYAGGISRRYGYNSAGLDLALGRILELSALSEELRAEDMRGLLKIYELRERLVLCRSLIAHLKARRETRWPGFSRYLDYPECTKDGQCYVNSQLVDNEIKIIYRRLL